MNCFSSIVAFFVACVTSFCVVPSSWAQSAMVNVLGDSYVANHRRPYQEAWHYLWAQERGYIYNNYGRNGGCVAFDRSREGFGPSLLVRYRQMDPSASLVVIVAGHNDAVKVGLSTDSLRMFADSCALLIDRVRDRCPRARVVWVTPWYVDRPGFAPVVKAIRRVCRHKRVPVLNNYRSKCVVKVRDEAFRSRYFQRADDTAHLNAAGHEYFLPTAARFLDRVIAEK